MESDKAMSLLAQPKLNMLIDLNAPHKVKTTSFL